MKNFLLLLCLTIFSLSSFGASNRVLDADQIDGQKQNRNYLKTFDAEKNVKGWVCTGGGSQSVTRTATTPLAGLGSFIFTLPAVNDACYFPFTIDSGDLATVLRTTFKHLPITTVGTYADGEFEIDILDGSGVAIESKIQPSQIFGNSLPTNQPYGEWQTQPANLNYRFVIKRVVASSTSTLKVDSLFTGQETKISGTVITDWKDCSPTIALTGGAYTVAAKCMRDGPNLRMKAKFTWSSIFTGGNPYVTLPAGYSIDPSVFTASVTPINDSSVTLRSESTGSYDGEVTYLNSTQIRLFGKTPATLAYAGVTTTFPFTWSNTDSVQISITVPIAGWSSNQVLSENIGTREIVVKATKSGDQTITGSSTTAVIAGWTIVKDTTASFNATTGIFTAPETGTYDFSQTVYYLNGASAPGYVDITGLAAGTSSGEYYTDVQAANKGYTFTIASSSPLKKGETYNLQAYSSTNNTTIKASGTNIFIAKRSSPQQIVASEKVIVSATNASGQALTSAGIIAGWVKVTDSHNAFNATTGIFTSPKSSTCTISYNFLSLSGLYEATFATRINSTDVNRAYSIYSGASKTTWKDSLSIPVMKDQTIDIYNRGAIVGASLYNSDIDNRLTIFCP